MKEPDPAHPIVIAPHQGRLRVMVAGTVVPETTRALALREADDAPVFYVPPEDVRAGLLAPNPRRTYCPYKGVARYHDLIVDGARRPAAAWSYETPYPAVARIRGHLAFYPDKVDAIGTA